MKYSVEGSSPHDVPLQHVHNLKPPYALKYHALEHSQHAEIITTCNTNISKDCKEVLNLEVEIYQDILDQEPFANIQYKLLTQHHLFMHNT